MIKVRSWYSSVKLKRTYKKGKPRSLMKLTLNSSNVKLTNRTPHHGSIANSAGCAGRNSFSIDLFSFHIIFWNIQNYKKLFSNTKKHVGDMFIFSTYGIISCVPYFSSGNNNLTVHSYNTARILKFPWIHKSNLIVPQEYKNHQC